MPTAAGGPSDGGSDFESPEEMMGEYAELFIGAATQPGEAVTRDDFDYSVPSLAHLDAYLGHYHDHGKPLPDGNHVAASAYLFETLRRAHGGRYLSGPETDPWVLVVGEPDCRIGVLAMSKVRGRAVHGMEDNIPFFVDGLPGLLERGQDATLT